MSEKEVDFFFCENFQKFASFQIAKTNCKICQNFQPSCYMLFVTFDAFTHVTSDFVDTNLVFVAAWKGLTIFSSVFQSYLCRTTSSRPGIRQHPRRSRPCNPRSTGIQTIQLYLHMGFVKTEPERRQVNPLNIAIVRFIATFSKANFSSYSEQNRVEFHS